MFIEIPSIPCIGNIICKHFFTEKKAETEVETILIHLENQNELILKILERLQQLETKSTN
jgi:hypothetical protein